MTLQARLYQLENGHKHKGVLIKRAGAETEQFEFLYGYPNSMKSVAKTQLLHGLQGNSVGIVIQTVEKLDFKIADKILFENGQTSAIINLESAELDKMQLRFTEDIDILTTITLSNIEGGK